MHYVLVLTFPAILIAFQMGLQYLSGLDYIQFIGPTLAAAAISFIVPLTHVQVTKDRTGDGGVIVQNIRHIAYSQFCYLVILIGLFAWLATCHFANINAKVDIEVPWTDVNYEAHVQFVVGSFAYVISLILVAIRGLL